MKQILTNLILMLLTSGALASSNAGFETACVSNRGQFFESMWQEWNQTCGFSYRRSRMVANPPTPTTRNIAAIAEACPSKEAEVYLPESFDSQTLLIKCK